MAKPEIGRQLNAGHVQSLATLVRPTMERMGRYAVVYGVNGKIRPVKNLGWLLRNWKNVEAFVWFRRAPSVSQTWDGILVAVMRASDIYLTTYQSEGVMLSWINRPVFRGLPFIYASWDGTIMQRRTI